MSRKSVLYLPSTPLNILVSVAHALAFHDQQDSYMVIIDQREVDSHPYLKSLRAWQESPFVDVKVLAGNQRGLAKLKQRKQNFAELSKLIEQQAFDAIAVGSDRRVEFQFAMHKSRQLKHETQGWYLDDGLYSYAGRSSTWYQELASGFVKKLLYGFWWREPKTVGASDWIDTAWLFKPGRAVTELGGKNQELVKPEWFYSQEIKSFSGLVLRDQGNGSNELLADLKNIDLCLLLPHPNSFNKIEGYRSRLEALIELAQKEGIKVAVKYHPRSQGDELGLVDKFGIQLIPSALAFEVILLELEDRVRLLGDVGTSLLTAKWLRPDIKSFALLSGGNLLEKKMASLLNLHGVEVNSDMKRVLESFYASK